MVARICIYLLLILLLTDWYFDRHYLRKVRNGRHWKRLLLWVPSIVFSFFTVKFALIRNFMPDDPSGLYLYLFVLGVFILPKIFIALCSFTGLMICRLRHSGRNWGNLIGIIGALYIIYITIYGSTIGFDKLEVKHVDIYSKDIPPAFEGYRMVHISDFHIGTYIGNRVKILERTVDSIIALHPDAVLFTGDLQNVQPQELYPVRELLARLKAKDGVFSVLGNHDYSEYIKAEPAIKIANEKEMISRQRQMGWTLLMNEHRAIHRGNDSIIIAGTENDGKAPSPSKADLGKALQGVNGKDYVILLQHDPSSWRRSILPESKVQLTLCGHTHGGQISVLGLRPTLLSYREDSGMYEENGRQLYVTNGLGGTIPLRFGVSREIVVLTLHHKK